MFFASGQAMRDWLETNHATSDELWAGIYKKGSEMRGITLPEAQGVAMCFGWVDSMSRRIDDNSYMLRFTPRRPRSSWTTGNVLRAEELLAQGLMHDAGIRVFERRRSR